MVLALLDSVLVFVLLVSAYTIAYVRLGCNAPQVSSNKLCPRSSHEGMECVKKYSSWPEKVTSL